jgi:hypothetical protein
MHTTLDRPERSVRLTLILAVVAAFLVGCGGTSSDPFAGTWRLDSGDKPTWVIRPVDDGYSIVAGWPGRDSYRSVGTFTRNGDQLVERRDAPAYTITHSTDPDRLTLLNRDPSLPTEGRTTLVRLSDSTATPTPVP